VHHVGFIKLIYNDARSAKHYVSLNKEMFPFTQWPKERIVSPCSPKAGPVWKQTSISRALLSISFGVPSKHRSSSKGALPPDSPHRAPSERDSSFLETSLFHLSNLPVHKPISRLPSGAPLERDASLQSPPYTTSRVPSKLAPLFISPLGGP
jgi:hypothetical protein